MSYTTNSTANRLKINKGWKNPSFPETLPLYSRDNVFFFKLYLFLKAYFTLKRTRLVYCDLRNSENYTKILYLVINSVPKKFKKKKSFRTWYVRKTPSGLKYSQFRNAQIHQAVNLLYLDLPQLKQQISAKLLPLAKQKVNNVFYTKTRYKSWINFLAKIKGIRNSNKFYLKNKTLHFAPINFHNLNTEQSLTFKLKRLKNQIIVLNRFFSTLKQKKNLTKQNILLYKTQLITLKTKFAKLHTKIAQFNLKLTDEIFINSYKNLNTMHNTKALHFNKIAHVKTIINNVNKSKQKLTKKLISKNLLNHRLNIAKKILNTSTKVSLANYKLWVKTAALTCIKKHQLLLKINEIKSTRLLQTNLHSLKVANTMNNKLSKNVLNTKKHQQLLLNTIAAYAAYLKNTNYLNNYRTFTKFKNLFKLIQGHSNNLDKISTLNVLNSNQTVNYPTTLKTINLTRKKRTKRGGRNKFTFALLRRLRIKHKIEKNTRILSNVKIKRTVDTKNVLALVNSFEKGYKQLIKKNTPKNKKIVKKSVWKLRESFRQTYKRHTETLIKYQYKLNLQKVLLNYFKMHFEVKIIRPLAQFKNLKFLRLVYPLRKFQQKSSKKEILFKKTLRKLSIKEQTNPKSNALISLRRRYILMGNRTKRFININSNQLQKSNIKNKNTYIFKKTANEFKRLRRQELLDFTQQRLNDVRRTLIMRDFAPVASLCIKYLNPQLLADHIAKEFEKTKRHQSIIFGLSQALRSLPFARAKGYRIAIAGRINSASKSRSYLLKRNILVRQDFSRKVNFASSQARARIGSFGIKVWIFY